ncbi:MULTISPECIES: YdcH family protein [unclassified Phenylobacterium]|uniref:YdcH family protein n=1 Tax=unclassified Phenylobacterium TaxID=2640670 RepID=UPI00083A2804|nr:MULTISPECIES: YdcH family protein [unclassified Phenylobacterium]
MNHHRIWRLRHRHRQLEQLIRREQAKPAPDQLAIQDLKRRKLQVKDELFLAEAGLAPVSVRMSHA